jgi:hypothetical protein
MINFHCCTLMIVNTTRKTIQKAHRFASESVAGKTETVRARAEMAMSHSRLETRFADH